MKAKIISGIFIIFIFGFTVLGMLLPDKSYSDTENRLLEAFPTLSADSILSGEFTDGFESYVADHFPARDSWITGKTLSTIALGGRDSGGVYLADDDYLMDKWDSVDLEAYEKNLGFSASFTDIMLELGVNTHFMLVPTAAAVLSDKLPPFAPEIDQKLLLDMAQQAGLPLIDVMTELSEHSTEYIYYRTDHHWTSLGAYYAYRAYMPETVPSNDYQIEIFSEEFLGTTYNKVGLPGAVPDRLEGWHTGYSLTMEHNLSGEMISGIFEREHLEESDKYPVYMGGNQAITTIRGGEQNGQRLLLIKDSYGNTFAQFAPSDYEEVHMIDLRYFNGSVSAYAVEHGITDALVLYSLQTFSDDTNIFKLR